MAKPPVSVIMPCYNGMPFVEDAFRGLLEQDYENMEIVLSDDCSSDESLEVAEKMASDYGGPHRVRIFRNEKQLGMGNYNRLVELAEHDFIVMAHADDLPDPSRVSLLVDAWMESGATLIASNAMVASAENQDVQLFWMNETSPDPTPEAVARKGRTSCPVSSQRHAANATSKVAAGTHQKNRIFGSENHLIAMRSKANGVQMLTIAMKPSTTSSSSLASILARVATLPSVFMINQVAPSKA